MRGTQNGWLTPGWNEVSPLCSQLLQHGPVHAIFYFLSLLRCKVLKPWTPRSCLDVSLFNGKCTASDCSLQCQCAPGKQLPSTLMLPTRFRTLQIFTLRTKTLALVTLDCFLAWLTCRRSCGVLGWLLPHLFTTLGGFLVAWNSAYVRNVSTNACMHAGANVSTPPPNLDAGCITTARAAGDPDGGHSDCRLAEHQSTHRVFVEIVTELAAT